jgi:hypothetical protein
VSNPGKTDRRNNSDWKLAVTWPADSYFVLVRRPDRYLIGEDDSTAPRRTVLIARQYDARLPGLYELQVDEGATPWEPRGLYADARLESHNMYLLQYQALAAAWEEVHKTVRGWCVAADGGVYTESLLQLLVDDRRVTLEELDVLKHRMMEEEE